MKVESSNNSHLARIRPFLVEKYKLTELLTAQLLEGAQRSKLYSDIRNKYNHKKLYRALDDPIINVRDSSIWLTKGNTSPRDEGALCALQDRNIFLEKKTKCPHCNDKLKTVDHMATQCERMFALDYMRRHNEVLRCILLQEGLRHLLKLVRME